MEKCEIISDYAYLCGESPIWDSRNEELWWSDILGGCIYKYNPKVHSVVKVTEGKNVGSFAFNKKGGLVCSTNQGLYLWDEKNDFQLITDTYKGDSPKSSDAIADKEGRFIFGGTFYEPGVSTYPLGKLYKVDRDGSISILEEGIYLTNGLGFSPNNKKLYYTDSALRTIYVYDYNLKAGSISNRHIFARVPDNEGLPDGLTVDAEGFVWSAQWYGSCIVRYDPDGKVERYIKTPSKQTASLIFGGKELTDIYVTTAAKSVRSHLAPVGYDFDAPDIGGPVYRYNFGIKGKPEYFADINFKK